ncbi:MAG: hypothetical protein IPO07_18310 [Haliscomenobacter sp.]|nr:hypothetical protein [Haliscomenobacter sp.]MBK9490510.1 hypothetical protein [Haliscomenobacter sp.]
MAKEFAFFKALQQILLSESSYGRKVSCKNTAYWSCSYNLADISTTSLIATLDSGLTFIANGKLLEKKDNRDGTVTFHYQTTQAYPIYLTAFVAGTYTDLVQHVRGIPLHTFVTLTSGRRPSPRTVRLPDMLQFMENKTGFCLSLSTVRASDGTGLSLSGLTGKIAPASFPTT